ncbi:MAG: hypothetical protein FWC61_04615 [Proteobacteria bacterium]|nr:hypothetical protein [Pseudomonadota bacterium]
MPRILQLRRGTTAQHETFTGQRGETTFDTDANTIRVHDGATAGGFALARADFSNIDPDTCAEKIKNTDFGTETFDMNTVPPEFWNNLFQKYVGTPPDFAANGGLGKATLEYGLVGGSTDFSTTKRIDLTNVILDGILLCKAADAGYSIGETVYAFGIGSRTAPKPVITQYNGSSMEVTLWINYEPFWVSHKSTGAQTNIDKTKWSVRFRLWHYPENTNQ